MAKTPLIKPSHRGRLHRALGVPQGSKISHTQLVKAAHSGSKHLRQMANFALNFHHKG